jgi:hypothetical protein
MSEISPVGVPRGKTQEEILTELSVTFNVHRKTVESRAKWAKRRAPILSVIAAIGSAFAGAAVATSSLSPTWKTAVIIVAFFSTAIGAGAAALRPTEQAQAAIADLANAEALCAWTDFLTLQRQRGPMDDADFNRAVNWLQTWRIHQLRPEPYAYDDRLPWEESADDKKNAPTSASPAANNPPRTRAARWRRRR